MKNLLKVLGFGLVALVVVVAAMAVFNICPPKGPLPLPPWCPGSSISWPFSDPDALSSEVGGSNAEGDDVLSNPADNGQDDGGDDSDTLTEISENERLAQVAIGLMQDLTSVNDYYSDAASSITNVNPSGSSITSSNSSDTDSGSGNLQVPDGFLDTLPDSGYIPAPSGACAAGASPSASFLNQKGEKITPELLVEKGIQTMGFDAVSGGSMGGSQLAETLTSLIPSGDPALATSAGWNQKVWSKMAENQTPAESLMDYHLWSVSEDIEAEVVASVRANMENMGLPGQVLNAFQASQTSGWFAGPAPQEVDRISAMEIEAVFSGRTEGTIHEKRDFSIPNLGEMPQFGPMDGEGNVVYHDPDFGDYPFALEIEWTKWDELGRVTEGTIIFTDEEHDVVIEMTVNEDNSRVAHVFRGGVEVGIVYVTPGGETTYEDLTK